MALARETAGQPYKTYLDGLPECHANMAALKLKDTYVKEEACIMTMPEELLCQIIELALLASKLQGETPSYDKKTIMAVAYTCKRFNVIAIPFQYHSMNLTIANMTPPPPRFVGLLHLLQQRPELAKRCRTLFVRCEEAEKREPSDYCYMQQLFRLLTNVQKLCILGGFNVEQTPELIGICTQTMTQLERLTLLTDSIFSRLQGLVIQNLTQAMNSPSLRCLEASCVRDDGPADETESELAGTSNVTNITLKTMINRLGPIQKLAERCKSLKALTLACHVTQLNPDVLQGLLGKQLHNLEYLRLQCQVQQGGEDTIPDFSNYSALQCLALCRCHMGDDAQYDWNIGKAILAPKLWKFIWDMSNGMLGCQMLSDFADEEENWVRSFAQQALESGSQLKVIQIEFNPHPFGLVPGELPWDRMEKLDEEFRPQGIAVTYTPSKPDWTRWHAAPILRAPETSEIYFSRGFHE
ncbi:hypothetical protein S40288_11186 [Stachybotrys chartarum IBT 40288]|nr:hypothetical protein S40288_11186 [Stachybotrys chartarum IBT 40288]